MGSTVTTGKQICAIRNPKTGLPIYLMFEETYEKNVYPHTPRWSAVNIGDLRDTLDTIFKHAASCEGGMLQSRSGHITPEGYIQAWLKALEAPYAYPDVRACMTLGSGWMDTLSTEKLSTTRAALSGNTAALAFLEQLEQAENGRFYFMLHESAGVLADILKAAHRQAWRIGIDHKAGLEVDCRMGYFPVKAKAFEIEVPEFMRIGFSEDRLMRHPDGSWRLAGWPYSIVGEHISGLADAEIRAPGSYRKWIKAYREAVENAPPIAMPVAVRIDNSDGLSASRWGAETLNRLIDAPTTTRLDDGGLMLDETELGNAKYAPPGMLVWEPMAQAA